jgi:hypothetical protein
MRIERDHDRRSIRGMSMARRCGNDRLMPTMHAVEYANSKEEGTAKAGQFADRMQCLHQENDE